MNSRLNKKHFLIAIFASSATHAFSFSVIMSLFLTIIYSTAFNGLLAFPLFVALYVTSYAIHELGHYYIALALNAQPIVWIDYRSVSVLSNPLHPSHGRLIACAGPMAAVLWIAAWWTITSFFSTALSFAGLIPGGLLASAHLGSLLPVFNDGKALTQHQFIKRSYP